MILLVVLALIVGAHGLDVETQTGTTPPAIECPSCAGRDDGNYNIAAEPNYFLQCSNGQSYCQACFPLSLVFRQDCNQCMYNNDDPCYTTSSWTPVITFSCPDLCPSHPDGPTFRGNIADPNEKRHYIGCWDGVTMGCVNCPVPLLFNEAWNACLYDGQYNTLPTESS